MFDLFLTVQMFPFSLSLALLFALLGLEVVFSLLGGTLLGAGGEGLDTPDFDAPELDFDLDMDLDLDGLDIDAGDLEIADLGDAELPDGASAQGGIAAWLGFGKMPAAIWLACVLMAFGLGGMTLQTVATAVFGALLPASLVAVPSGIGALWFARQFGSLFARLIPKTETEALSERHLGRRMGVITQGTAARGRPAEVRVTDRFGNTHYLRAEPLRDEAEIEQGSEVLVLRHRHQGGYLLVPMTL